jgi:16S rRNA (guanine(966)-N(2))-methyltransferase RsmD
MTRIIAGSHKGRNLKAPKGTAVRPTAARVKQTLFDILAPRLTGCRFLDAFAGTGGIGLEALSRGAGRVVMIDASAPAVGAIRENLEALGGGGGRVQVFRQEARIGLAALADTGVRFDVVFLDPPYDSGLYEPLLEQVAGMRLLEAEGVVVAEHFHKTPLPERIGDLFRYRQVRVGDHFLSFYRLERA